eukprot:1159958-Pelagomonas_calceolata.AAC.18
MWHASVAPFGVHLLRHVACICCAMWHASVAPCGMHLLCRGLFLLTAAVNPQAESAHTCTHTHARTTHLQAGSVNSSACAHTPVQVLDEIKRSLHDALCVTRNLVRDNAIVYGECPVCEVPCVCVTPDSWHGMATWLWTTRLIVYCNGECPVCEVPCARDARLMAWHGNLVVDNPTDYLLQWCPVSLPLPPPISLLGRFAGLSCVIRHHTLPGKA